MISTADLSVLSVVPQDDFFDGVATLTMVKFDLLLSCFKVCPRTLTFLLLLLLLFVVAFLMTSSEGQLPQEAAATPVLLVVDDVAVVAVH